MPDHLLIYVIVVLNALSHVLLIWKQKLPFNTKCVFCAAAIAIPLVIIITMRLLVAGGVMPGHVADQSFVEQCITKGTSMFLIAGPWLVTISAVMYKRRQHTVAIMQTAE